MRRVLCATALLWFIPVGTGSAQGTSVSGPPMEVDAQLRARLYQAMASDLRKLVTAQEVHFAEWAEYGKAFTSSSRTGTQLQVSPGVTVTLTYVTRATYAARATHEWLPGRSCIITVGEIPPSRALRTTLEGKTVAEDGAPICDSK